MFWFSNPLEKALIQAKKTRQKRFLIAWNRGLGDIALGLYALLFQIRKHVPDAHVTFLTRPDLKEGFQLLSGADAVILASEWKRGQPHDVPKTLHTLRMQNQFDYVIAWPDPTKWCSWQLGTLTPRMAWNEQWDAEALPIALRKDERKKYLAVHVHSETQYGYEKNWPSYAFSELFGRCAAKNIPIALLGVRAEPAYSFPHILDLRGTLTLIQLLAFVKNYCSNLLAPDSGILSLLYYLDVSFPIKVISLWSDPRQGILKQGVASPNPQLEHIPLLAPNEDICSISVDHVMEVL